MTVKLAPKPFISIGPKCDCGHVAFIHAGGFGKCLANRCGCKVSSVYDDAGARWGYGTTSK